MLTRAPQTLDVLNPAARVDTQSLVNTIHFITLFLDFNTADMRIKKVLEGWQKQEKMSEFGRKFPSAKEVQLSYSLSSCTRIVCWNICALLSGELCLQELFVCTFLYVFFCDVRCRCCARSCSSARDRTW